MPQSFRVSAGWLDLTVVLGALYGAASIGSETGVPARYTGTANGGTLLIGTAVIFTSQGLYRSVIRYMGQQAVWDLVKAVSFSTLTLALRFLLMLTCPPRRRWFWLLLFVGSGRVAPDFTGMASVFCLRRCTQSHYLWCR